MDAARESQDARRFSLISHGRMRFWNPLPVAGLVSLLRGIPLVPRSQVLDYGCGQGEVSRELASCFGAQITGVDTNPEAIERCRAKLAGTFLTEAFRPARFAPMSFDVIVNIGASPGMSLLLEQVVPLLKRPGRLLVGDLYWRQPPSSELLTFLGGVAAPVPTLEEHQAALVQKGFVVERELLATDTDWDHYEDEYDANMRAYLDAYPDDPSFAAFERRRLAWRAMYLEHGRGSLGFALYQARLDP